MLFIRIHHKKGNLSSLQLLCIAKLSCFGKECYFAISICQWHENTFECIEGIWEYRNLSFRRALLAILSLSKRKSYDLSSIGSGVMYYSPHPYLALAQPIPFDSDPLRAAGSNLVMHHKRWVGREGGSSRKCTHPHILRKYPLLMLKGGFPCYNGGLSENEGIS